MIPTSNPDRLFDPFATAGKGSVGVGRSEGSGPVLAADPLAAALLQRFDASVVEVVTERAAVYEYDAGLTRAAAEATVTDLYVATDLSYWPAPILAEIGRTGYAPVVVSDGREYRRLDAAWYGYLYELMAKARQMHTDGRLPGETWGQLRERFAAVHRFAACKGCAVVPVRVAA